MHYIVYLIETLKAVKALKANQFCLRDLKAITVQRMKTNNPQLFPLLRSPRSSWTMLKNSLHSLLQSESPYPEILLELFAGTRQVVKSNLIFKCMNSLLVVHDHNKDSDLDFSRIVVPDDPQTRSA